MLAPPYVPARLRIPPAPPIPVLPSARTPIRRMIRLVAVFALLALAGCRLEGRAPAPEAPPAAATPASVGTGAIGSDASGVTVYLTEWCPYCRATREYLDGRGIPYRAVDIEASPEAYEEYARQGGTGSIPLVVVGDERMQGYAETALAEMLARNGI